MRKSTNWVWVACAGMIGALAFGADPVPPAKPVAENWLPEPKESDDKTEPTADTPASAFPDLVFVRPKWDEKKSPAENREMIDEAFEKVMPRLAGAVALKIEATDDAPRKLLKARLQQGVLEHQRHSEMWKRGFMGPAPPYTPPFECLKDIQATVLKLWAGQPKELVPWLEELVVVAKVEERYAQLRVKAGAIRPSTLNYVTRHRLKAEAELWKAKNVKANRVEAPPAKKGDPKAKPADGDWVADKKVPPSLFPAIVLPAPDLKDPKWREKQAILFAEQCPRLSGKPGLKVEESDGTLQKLLKARLHQGALELSSYHADEAVAGPNPQTLPLRRDCMDDTLSTAVELFAKQPKDLVAWLEELLLDAKEHERGIQLRVEAGAFRPQELNAASRHRLKVEAELWKAKNAK